MDNSYTKGHDRWLLQFNTNNNCLRVTEGELVAFTLCWTKLSTLNIDNSITKNPIVTLIRIIPGLLLTISYLNKMQNKTLLKNRWIGHWVSDNLPYIFGRVFVPEHTYPCSNNPWRLCYSYTYNSILESGRQLNVAYSFT